MQHEVPILVNLCVFQPIIGTQIDHPLAFLYELSHGSLGQLIGRKIKIRSARSAILSGEKGSKRRWESGLRFREKIRDLFSAGLLGRVAGTKLDFRILAQQTEMLSSHVAACSDNRYFIHGFILTN